MSKNKKIGISIICIAIIIVVIILASYIYPQIKYSYENVNQLLNSEKESTNIHLTSKSNNDGENTVTDVYMKDNFYYIISKNDTSSEIISESFYNPDTTELIFVQNREPKSVITFLGTSQEDMFNNYFSNERHLSENCNAETYKYRGKEKVDGKQCIKIAFINNLETIYEYINLEDNRIIKEEIYSMNTSNELEKSIDITYTYSYDTVTDEEIKVFDKNNYLDYQFDDINVNE